MRVDYVMVLLPAVGDHRAHLVLVGPAATEQLPDLRQQLGRHFVGTPLVQVVHEHLDEARVLV